MNKMNGLSDCFSLLQKQLDSLFGLTQEEKTLIDASFDKLENALMYTFDHIGNKYYSSASIDSFHNCQYSIFLYKLSHFLYKESKAETLCAKLYNLLKMVSAADIFYQIELPDIFLCDHPVGTVLGRADYSDYFCFLQGCTIGNNKGKYPSLGKFVFMNSNAKVLGNCHIGSHVVISANTYIKDFDIPDNCLVFNDHSKPDGVPLIIQKNSKEMMKYFETLWNFQNPKVYQNYMEM